MNQDTRLKALGIAVQVAENSPNGKPNLGEAFQIAELLLAWASGDTDKFDSIVRGAEPKGEPRRKCGCGTTKDPGGFCDGSHELLKPKTAA